MRDYHVDSIDHGKKMLMALCWLISMLAFAGVTLFHVEVWAQKQEMDVRTVAMVSDLCVSPHP